MAGRYNIIVEQNSAFSLPVNLTTISGSTESPLNLTGYTAKASIKKNYQDTKVFATMSVNNVLNTSGSVDLGITATQTKLIPVGSYVWDFIIITGSVQTRILEGVCSVTPYVTE